MANAEHDGRLQAAEQAVDAVMQGYGLTAMEWATVFTQCLLGTVIEELDGILGDDDEDIFSAQDKLY